MKRAWHASRLISMAVVSAALVGCGSAPTRPEPPPPPPERRPAEFSLAVRVLAPAEGARAGAARSLTPAGYIVEPDAVLRAGTGSNARAEFPARARQLTPAEMDQLWTTLLDSGLLDPGSPALVTDPRSAVASQDRPTAVMLVTLAGQRRMLRIRLDRGTPEALAAERVIDRLASWAWVGEGR